MCIRKLIASACWAVLLSCQQQGNHSLTVLEIYDKHLVSKDIVNKIADPYYALHFRQGFKEDAIAVFANEKKKHVFLATTDEAVSLATTVTLAKKGITAIEVKIDGYGLLHIIPDARYNYLLIDLDKEQKQLKIRHTNITPKYL
ncbi:hypothetical protein [Hymenobacter canadensis]|uniref:Uncharacterized protein n=1 Tax=Hymenobacter canadensis TaxID=2999067 RepID=A0ABY7LX77_9BACT|nr:hypothetical protein [Hymenobacter canadensis]WBA44199.1 hypothetical protein O3303_20135 [Hymenobacter canadensis]